MTHLLTVIIELTTFFLFIDIVQSIGYTLTCAYKHRVFTRECVARAFELTLIAHIHSLRSLMCACVHACICMCSFDKRTVGRDEHPLIAAQARRNTN